MVRTFSIITLLSFGINSIWMNEPPHPTYPISQEIHKLIQTKKAYVQPAPETDWPGKHFIGYIIVEASVEEVYNVIYNFQDYPQFMPYIINVDSVPETKMKNFRYYLELPFGVKYQYQISAIKHESSAFSWVTWKLEEWEKNNIEDTWGQWVISPYLKTNSTLIQYQVFTDIGHVPLGLNWMVNRLTEYSLPDVLTSTKNWIDVNEK